MKITLSKRIIVLLGAIGCIVLFQKIAFAVWNGQPYNPGETDNPDCLPSQVNCDVIPALTSEVDPVFTASSAFTISGADIGNWNSKQDALGFTPVANTLTINGYPLSANITLTKADVGLSNVPNLSFSGSNTGDETRSSILTKLGAATGSADGYLSSADWNAFAGKQDLLTGDGFVKSTGGVISYDTNTYLTSNQPITLSGDVAGSGTTVITTTIGNGAVTNAKLANSTITINGVPVALGGSGTFTTSAVSEGANLYYTQARFDTAFSGKSTSDLAEGSNLYFTDSRAQAALAGMYEVPLTFSTGLTRSGDTIAIDPTVATLTGVQILTHKDLTSGTNIFPTFNQDTTGNAATATALQISRTINGVPFDGTSNITIAAPASGVTVGATTVGSGSPDGVLYDNSGVLGEMTTSGSGTQLALTNSPTFITPTLGAATATKIITNYTGSSFTGAAGIFADNYSSATGTGNIGVVGLGAAGGSTSGYGVWGAAATAGSGNAYAVYGNGVTTSSSNTGTSYAGYFLANGGHAAGSNIAVYGNAVNGATNYSFYGAGGTLYNAGKVSLGTTSATAAVNVAASTTSLASLNIASGTAPTSPNSGDMYFNGTHLYFDIGSTNYQLDQQSGGLAVGNTAITSGSSGSLLYDNAGTLGEYALSGSGSVAMTNSPIFTTPSLGAASASSLNISGLTASKVIFTDASKNLTSTGIGTSSQFIKGDGSLDSNTYLTGNQTVTLSGDISGSGTTAITTTIGAGKVTNAMLTGSIAASKLVGTDIATVGTITSGVWQGTPIVDAYIASASTWNAKQNAITLTTTGTSGAATFSGGTLNIPQYTGTTYAAGTGLTLTGNTFSVNTTQNISTLSNLTTDGLIKTSGGTGALSIATAGTDYLTPTGSGALLTGIPTSVTNSDGTLTISPTTGSVVASLNLANANTWTAQQAISIANIGATPTSGLSLTNTTAAAAGAQQYSPSIHFTGQGWKTSAPAASEPVDMQMYLTPSQSTGTPASALIITSSLNGGAYSQIFSLSNGGTISIPGNFSMSGTSLFTSAIGTFKSVNTTTTALATTSTDGVYLTNTTAATSGVPVQYSPRVRWSGAAWTGSASQAADFIAEVKPVNGTSPVTAKWVLSSQINSGGYNPVFTVADNGYIGIGTTAPVYLLDVGNASVSGAVARFTNSTGSCTINPTLISFSCSSDQNLKKNITDLEDISTATSSDSPSQVHNVILNDILSLRPVTYNWKTENDSDPKHTGFIAQEVQQIFPDLVSEDPTTGYLSLNYIGLIPYTIQAIQEMNIKISPLPDFTDQSLADTVRAFLTDVAHGIVRSKELCADQVCVTSTQLQQMLDYIQAHQDAPVLSASTDTTTDDSSTTATGNNSTLVTPTIGSTTTGDTTTPPTSGASSDTASPAPTSSPGELIQGVSSSSDTPTQNSSDTSISSTDTAPALPTISS